MPVRPPARGIIARDEAARLGESMRIQDIHTSIVAVPVRHPIASAVRQTDQVINLLVEVTTDEGASGVAYVAGFTRQKARAVRALLAEVAEALRGADATAIGAAWERMQSADRASPFPFGMGGRQGLIPLANSLWQFRQPRGPRPSSSRRGDHGQVQPQQGAQPNSPTISRSCVTAGRRRAGDTDSPVTKDPRVYPRQNLVRIPSASTRA